MNRCYVKYQKAREVIQEGDILLFRGVSLISRFIRKFGGGEHSHVAIASWSGDILECIEFREFKGGRIVNMQVVVDRTDDKTIDVFRISPTLVKLRYNGESVTTQIIKWTPRLATNIMRRNAGLPYGWKTIILMARKKGFLHRLFCKPVTDDELVATSYPVCSTAIVSAVRQVFIDLVPFLPDFYVEPPDLARCPLLNYILTITKDR